jgi:hypothetical protein
MHPALVAVSTANLQPLSLGAANFGTVTKKNLIFLCCCGARLVKYWSNRRPDADVSWAQCSGQSMSGISRSGVSGMLVVFPSTHFLQTITPRKLQITQMKVPHSAHG